MGIIKKAKVCKKTLMENGVGFVFADGRAITCNLDDLPEDIKHQCTLYGLSQKLGDAYASADSIDEAVMKHANVWENLQAGIFRAKAGGTGGKVVEALRRHSGRPLEDCVEIWNGMDKEEQANLRKHPDIKTIMAAIDLERATKELERANSGTGEEVESLDSIWMKAPRG